ncbi:MAG: type II secretion system F family protein [Pseudomonadota bacterium]
MTQLFHYRGVTANGDVIDGDLEAAREDDVIAHLHAQNMTPLSIGAASTNGLAAFLSKDISFGSGVSKADVLALTRSLATLLEAGIDIDRALDMTVNLEKAGHKKTLLEQMLADVRRGKSLAEAADRHPKVFSPFYRNMVKAGDAGARLGDVLSRLAGHLERSQRLASEIRSAMVYPAFLLTAALGAVGILLAVVVPTFEPIFRDSGASLPNSTAVIIAAGDFVSRFWPLLLLALFALLCGGAYLLSAPTSRLALHRFALKIPVMGSLWRSIATARLSRTLSALCDNGVSLPQAMALTQPVVGNAHLERELERVASEVEMGRGLASPLAQGDHFPQLAVQLIDVGEESGRLVPMLEKLADIYEDETRTQTARMVSLLTPIMTLGIGALIAFIVSSILFALFSINELAR